MGAMFICEALAQLRSTGSLRRALMCGSDMLGKNADAYRWLMLASVVALFKGLRRLLSKTEEAAVSILVRHSHRVGELL